MDIRTYLQQHVLLFDGAMGTCYAARYPGDQVSCEPENLTHPERILEIHRAYLEAGCRAIKTNTFAANTAVMECSFEQVREIIIAGWRIACEAAAPADAFVFADIGPLPALLDENEYYRILDTFLELGAEHFLFETFPDDRILPALAAYIRERSPEAFILTSFAAAPDGFTRSGSDVRALIGRMAACKDIDAVGLNCVSGPSHMLRLIGELPVRPPLLSVMPNAGYPTMVRGRTFFEGDPHYFASRMGEIARSGARILGGCCGTTPAHIVCTAEKLAALPQSELPQKMQTDPAVSLEARNRLAEKLQAGKRVIAVELDPPADASLTKFMDGARTLKQCGVDAVTIADCPIARARADSSMLAAKLHRELDIDPIPHMTCRDRNINATKALLFGLSGEGVHNVLTVTGDPIPGADRAEVKGVFSFNSAMLAAYIRDLCEQGMVAPFTVYGALNVNARNFDAELKKAVRKVESGVAAFLTQPLFTDRSFENLRLAHETLPVPILGGVIPIVSHRNALFMHHEVAGIELTQEVIDRYEGLDRAAAEELAVELSVELARRMEPDTAGWYLITPFGRVGLIARIMEQLKPDCNC